MISTAPGSLLYYICLRDLFLFAFIFRSINKNTKIPCCNLFLFILSRFPAIQSIIFLSRSFANFRHRYPKGIDNPFYTSGCEYLLFLCGSCLRIVAWFSYWFNNHGLINEGNTYRRCVPSSLPLWGNTNVASSCNKRNFWRRCRGGSSTYIRFLITNLISWQFTLFAICLSFSSPPHHKNLLFYSPSFSFATFLPNLFLSAILLRSHNDSREHQVV